MNTAEILQSSMLDILFEGKNKTYGAYELRATYNKRIVVAIVSTLVVAILFMVSSVIAGKSNRHSVVQFVDDVVLDKFDEAENQKEIPPIQSKQEFPKEAMSQYNVPEIVQDELVNDDNSIENIEILEDTKIGNINKAGIKGDDLVEPPVENTTGVIGAIKEDDEIDKVFTVVQIPSEFPGGVQGWSKYLERNLNRDLPVENGAPPARYTVIVSFIVDKNGNISEVKAENDPGFGVTAEAIRVIAKGPNWKPAIQNGQPVIYRHKQSITFQVSEE